MTSIDDFAFTRYLYSIIDVRQSLLMALLDRQREEALFWVYELYFSSEDRTTFDYVIQIYEYLYKQHNPEFETFINKLLLEWEKDPELHHHIGTIVWNLCGRDYCVATFINEIIHRKATPVPIEKPRTKLKVHLKPENVVKYNTITTDEMKAYTVPAKACLYPTRKNVHNIFSTFVPENIQEIYSKHWEYYANRTPIWQNRFEDCEAHFDDETKTIRFLENNNDADANQSQFYDHWGYEPDEQPVSVHEKWMGTGKEVQITMKEFATKYGATITPIKIRTNKKKPILENTIEFSETTGK